MTEFGVPKKLIEFVRMCMEESHYQIKVDQTVSEAFTSETSLNKGKHYSHYC